MNKATFKTLPGYINIIVDKDIVKNLTAYVIDMNTTNGGMLMSEIEHEITELIHDRVKLELRCEILQELSYNEREEAIEDLMDNYRDDGLLCPTTDYEIILGGYNKKKGGERIIIKPL